MSEINSSLRHGLNAWPQNPVFVHALGLSPLLAVTTSISAAATLLACFAFLLLTGSALHQVARPFINDTWRIASLVAVLAVLTTVMDAVLSSYVPALREELGIYLPLLCCNFAVVVHIEAQRQLTRVQDSIIPTLAVIAGYGIVLLVLAAFREYLALGVLHFEFAMTPAGALLLLGLLTATSNALRNRFGSAQKAGDGIVEPAPRARVTEKLQ